jgi:hypothetical protein
LRHYLERHDGQDRIVAWVKHPVDGTFEQVWESLMAEHGRLGAGHLSHDSEGFPYAISPGREEIIRGTVEVFAPPKQFIATVDDWNDALFRIYLVERPGGGGLDVSIWLATYGVPAARVPASIVHRPRVPQTASPFIPSLLRYSPLTPAKNATGEPKVKISGPPVSIGFELIQTFGLALHELATNASKYGALANNSGQIRLSWELVSQDQESRLRLCWTESGGPPVTAPSHAGFGSFLMNRVLKAERGEVRLEYKPQGLVATFELTS